MTLLNNQAHDRKRALREYTDGLKAEDDAPPRTMAEATARRDAAISESIKIEREMAWTMSEPAKKFLAEAHEVQHGRIRAMNAWIREQNIATSGAASDTRRPETIVEMAPPKAGVAPCPSCNRPIAGQRGAVAWHYYCGDCGRDWQVAAPAIVPPRPKRVPGKLCACRFLCRFCRKPKR